MPTRKQTVQFYIRDDGLRTYFAAFDISTEQTELVWLYNYHSREGWLLQIAERVMAESERLGIASLNHYAANIHSWPQQETISTVPTLLPRGYGSSTSSVSLSRSVTIGVI